MLLRIWDSLPMVLGMIVMTGGTMIALRWLWECWLFMLGVRYDDDDVYDETETKED